MSGVLRVLDCLFQADGFHVYLYTPEDNREGHEGDMRNWSRKVPAYKVSRSSFAKDKMPEGFCCGNSNSEK